MADDLTTAKVQNDLQNEIRFYNDKISEQTKVVDPADEQKQAQIEQMRRERDQRITALENVRANADNPNVLIK